MVRKCDIFCFFNLLWTMRCFEIPLGRTLYATACVHWRVHFDGKIAM